MMDNMPKEELPMAIQCLQTAIDKEEDVQDRAKLEVAMDIAMDVHMEKMAEQMPMPGMSSGS